MKGSSATSAKAATADSPRRTGRSSARRQPTRTSAESFALTGPAKLPDPATHAYRKDLADIALAGEVLASHYAAPAERMTLTATQLRVEPSLESEPVGEIGAGEPFSLLDDSLGWAWGYAGRGRRVGYVPSGALSPGRPS